jgi:hypothetical protein
MRGVAVSDGFHLDAAASCRCLNPHHGHCLAASWRSVVAFRASKRVSSHHQSLFGAQSHGLFTRYLRFAAFLPGCPVVQPRKTRFSPVVNLDEVGLATHKVPNEVSVHLHLTFPPSRLCLAQWML